MTFAVTTGIVCVLPRLSRTAGLDHVLTVKRQRAGTAEATGLSVCRLITDEGVVGGLRVVGAGASLPG
jgi:hypothetical protein